ncbi:unnamed protein product [Prunus armeniaca]
MDIEINRIEQQRLHLLARKSTTLKLEGGRVGRFKPACTEAGRHQAWCAKWAHTRKGGARLEVEGASIMRNLTFSNNLLTLSPHYSLSAKWKLGGAGLGVQRGLGLGEAALGLGEMWACAGAECRSDVARAWAWSRLKRELGCVLDASWAGACKRGLAHWGMSWTLGAGWAWRSGQTGLRAG